MKHFLVESTYLVPLATLETVRGAHRVYLQAGIDQGMVLCAGPQASGVGGVILVRGDSQETIEAFFASDPYVREGFARYRYVEFKPVLHAPLLADWTGAA
ncbi:YciI family protein [Nevskia sp.]|uniref:YciI family protein n=1 Tax=Nevskia sp. TaxID=1929292 RepID=UPI0025F0585B|nr:YciI family protein [Nevskia sp.]